MSTRILSEPWFPQITQNEEVIIKNGKIATGLHANWQISQNTARFQSNIRPLTNVHLSIIVAVIRKIRNNLF